MSKIKTFLLLLFTMTLFLGLNDKNTMTHEWDRLKKWLYKSCPLMVTSLNKGASSEQLSELEKTLDVSLPEDYKDFLQIHNGQIFNSPALVDLEVLNSTDFILSEWKFWKELYDAGEFKSYQSTPDNGIKNDWWNPSWIPITSNGYGDHICIDLDPTSGGTKGQIISMFHDDPRRELLALSFKKWLRNYIEDLEKGIHIYSEEYGGIIRKSDLEN